MPPSLGNLLAREMQISEMHLTVKNLVMAIAFPRDPSNRNPFTKSIYTDFGNRNHTSVKNGKRYGKSNIKSGIVAL